MEALLGLLTVFSATFVTPFAQAQPAAPAPRLPADINYLEYTVAQLHQGQFSTDPVQLSQLTREGRVAQAQDFQGAPQVQAFIFTADNCTSPGAASSYRIVVENTGNALAEDVIVSFSFGGVPASEEFGLFSDAIAYNADPPYQTFVSATPLAQGVALNTAVWPGQDIAPGGLLSFTVQLRTEREAQFYHSNVVASYAHGGAPVNVTVSERAQRTCANINAAGERVPTPAIVCHAEIPHLNPCFEFDPETGLYNRVQSPECQGPTGGYAPYENFRPYGPDERGCVPTFRRLALGPRYDTAKPAQVNVVGRRSRCPVLTPEELEQLPSHVDTTSEHFGGFGGSYCGDPETDFSLQLEYNSIRPLEELAPDLVAGDCRTVYDDIIYLPLFEAALAKHGRSAGGFATPPDDTVEFTFCESGPRGEQSIAASHIGGDGEEFLIPRTKQAPPEIRQDEDVIIADSHFTPTCVSKGESGAYYASCYGDQVDGGTPAWTIVFYDGFGWYPSGVLQSHTVYLPSGPFQKHYTETSGYYAPDSRSDQDIRRLISGLGNSSRHEGRFSFSLSGNFGQIHLPNAASPTALDIVVERIDTGGSYCGNELGDPWWAPDCSCDCGQGLIYLAQTGSGSQEFETGSYCTPGEGAYTGSSGSDGQYDAVFENWPFDYPYYRDFPPPDGRYRPGHFIVPPNPEAPGGQNSENPQSAVPSSHLLTWLRPLIEVRLVPIAAAQAPEVFLAASCGSAADEPPPSPLARGGNQSVPFTVTVHDAQTGEQVAAPRDVAFTLATSDGSALAGQDYEALQGEHVIPAGQSALEVAIPVIPDELVEGDEMFFVDILDAQGAGLGGQRFGMCSITGEVRQQLPLAEQLAAQVPLGPAAALDLPLPPEPPALEEPEPAPVLEAELEPAQPLALEAPVDVFLDRKLDDPGEITIQAGAADDPNTKKLTYHITIGNSSADPAEDVLVTDHLPAQVEYVCFSGLSGATCRDPGHAQQPGGPFGECTHTPDNGGLGGTVECRLGTIEPSGSRTFTIVVVPRKIGPQEIIGSDGTLITNCATVSAINEPDGDFYDFNNGQCEQTVIRRGVDLHIEKDDVPDPVSVNEELTYTIAVRNPGGQEATDVQVTDVLPNSVRFESARTSDGSCDFIFPAGGLGGTVTCQLGTVAAGATKTVTITVVPTRAGVITNQAEVHPLAGPGDENEDNNSVSIDTTVLGSADLEIVKEDDKLSTDVDENGDEETDIPPGRVESGEPLEYTITVTNHGPDTATDVVLKDTLPNGVVPPGENNVTVAPPGVCTKNVDNLTNTVTSIECKWAEIAPGQTVRVTIVFRPRLPAGLAALVITNTAEAEWPGENPDPRPNSDDETTEVVGQDHDQQLSQGWPPGHPPALSQGWPPGHPPALSQGWPPGHPPAFSQGAPPPVQCPPGTQPIPDAGDDEDACCIPPGEPDIYNGSFPSCEIISCPDGQEPFDTDGDGIADECRVPGECPSGTQPCHPVNGLRCPDNTDGDSEEETLCYEIPWIPESKARFNPPAGQRIKWHDVFITSPTECLADFQGEHHFNDAPAVRSGSGTSGGGER